MEGSPAGRKLMLRLRFEVANNNYTSIREVEEVDSVGTDVIGMLVKLFSTWQ